MGSIIFTNFFFNFFFILKNKTQKETPKNLTSISIQSLDANDEEKIKFLKLMGVKVFS